MLIFDIETKTFGDKPDPAKDEFRYIGFYEYDIKKYHFYSYKEQNKIKAIFKKHRVIIGFNSRNYDEPILKRAGIWSKNHLHLDLYNIVKKRQGLLGCKNESKSLRNLAKFFKLNIGKGDLDYNLLKKDENTIEELELIKKYTLQDIKVTKELTDYIFNYFTPFKEYLNDYQNRQFYWVTSSIASYTYKVICNLAGLKEEYSDDCMREKYEGGFVAEPLVDEEHEDILLFDFTSLYPFTLIQNNLIDKSKDKLGKIETIILNLYKKRLEYKKVGDTREYVIKIIINSFYGILANPIFKNVYDIEVAKKITEYGRAYINLARDIFNDFGYKVLYTDTDSVYIKLVNQTKQQAEEIAELIVKKIQLTQTFPNENFKFKIDDEIKHIYFFKHNEKRLKKLYIYVTNNNKVIIKGLPIIKNDSSNIGLIIFNKYIKDEIKAGRRYVPLESIKSWVTDLLTNDINIALRVFKVRSKGNYKLNSQLQYKISEKYGAGRHKLIGNNKIGVGCGTKFCTIKEFKDNNLTIDDINLSKFWKEMSFFLKEPYRTKKQRKKTKRKAKNNMLSKWL